MPWGRANKPSTNQTKRTTPYPWPPSNKKPWMEQKRNETTASWTERLSMTCYFCGKHYRDDAPLQICQDSHDNRGNH